MSASIPAGFIALLLFMVLTVLTVMMIITIFDLLLVITVDGVNPALPIIRNMP